IQDSSIPLNEEVAVAVNPWEPHSFHAGDRENGSLFLVLYIKPIWFLETARHAQSWLRFGRSRIEMTSQIRRSVNMVVSLLLEGEETGLFDGYLYELTRECFDQSWQWTPNGAPRVDCASPFTDFRVRNSMKLMSEKLGEEFELDDVARESGLSRPHFYKLFRKQTGLTPNLFLNTLRMERAIESLTGTDKSVTHIGFDLGFSSQASFTRFFTSNVGIAPSDYRRVAHLALN
ncbi:MAG: helix-turn-helix transcriptional regulator, partial [Geminicoccaceae bacterium]